VVVVDEMGFGVSEHYRQKEQKVVAWASLVW